MPTVTVELGEDGGRALIAVADDGPGIPAEDQPFVFDRFYRGLEGSNRSTKSLGIGLFLVNQIVTRLGGTISFVSDSKGTRFEMTLPIGGPDTAAAP